MSNINGVKSSGQSGQVASSKKSSKASRKAASTQADKTDQLHLSADAVMLSDLQQALTDVPEVDVIKVEQIRQAIKDGKLPLNRERLAAKMLELQNELKDL